MCLILLGLLPIAHAADVNFSGDVVAVSNAAVTLSSLFRGWSPDSGLEGLRSIQQSYTPLSEAIGVLAGKADGLFSNDLEGNLDLVGNMMRTISDLLSLWASLSEEFVASGAVDIISSDIDGISQNTADMISGIAAVALCDMKPSIYTPQAQLNSYFSAIIATYQARPVEFYPASTCGDVSITSTSTVSSRPSSSANVSVSNSDSATVTSSGDSIPPSVSGSTEEIISSTTSDSVGGSTNSSVEPGVSGTVSHVPSSNGSLVESGEPSTTLSATTSATASGSDSGGASALSGSGSGTERPSAPVSEPRNPGDSGEPTGPTASDEPPVSGVSGTPSGSDGPISDGATESGEPTGSSEPTGSGGTRAGGSGGAATSRASSGGSAGAARSSASAGSSPASAGNDNGADLLSVGFGVFAVVGALLL